MQKTIESPNSFEAKLLDVVEQAIVVIDMQGMVLYWNRFAEQLYGWTKAEAMGRKLRELVTPQQSIQMAEEILALLRQGKSWNGHFLARHRNGREFFVDITDAPIFGDDGELIGIIGAAKDATLRLQAEDALRASEEFNRSVLESSTDCIKVLNPDGTLISMNGPGMCAMEIDDLTPYVGRPWAEMWGQSSDEVLVAVQDAIEHGIGRFSSACITPKGTQKYWDVIISPILGKTGQPKRLVSISRDVTAQRQSMEVLQRNEEEYRALFYQSAVGKAEMNLRTDGLTRVNRKMGEIFGYSANELLKRTFQSLVHQDDLAVILAERAAMLTGLQNDYKSEYRIVRKDGKVRWIESNISRLRNSENKPLYAIAAIQDITDRKRVAQEQALLASIGPILSKPDNEQDLADGLASTMVPDFVDGCSITFFDSDQKLPVVAEAYAEDRDSLLQYRIPLLATARPELYNHMSDADFAAMHPTRQKLLSEIRRQGIRSFISVPMLVRGQVAGVMALVQAHTGREFDQQDLNFAEEVSRRVALALDNLQLLRGERKLRESMELVAVRIARLQQVTAALSKAATPAEVVQAIVDESSQAFDAQAAAIHLLDITREDRNEVYTAYSHGYPERLTETYRRFSLDANVPAAVAIRQGETFWYENREELNRVYPEMADMRAELPTDALVTLPIRTDRGMLGALTLNYRKEKHFDPAERSLLLTMANQSAQAIERSYLYAAEKLAKEMAQENSRRTRALQAVTAALSNTLIPTQLASIVVEQGAQVLGAHAGFVAVLVEDESRLQVISEFGYEMNTANATKFFGMNTHAPIVEAIWQQASLWYESRAELHAKFGDLGHIYDWISDSANAWAAIPLIVENRVLGGIGLSFAEARQFTQDDKDFMIALAQQCAQSLQRAYLFQTERVARSAADGAAQRSAFLAESSRTLSESMNFDTRLSMAANLAVPKLADWCLVSAYDSSGTLHRASAAHHLPECVEALQTWSDQQRAMLQAGKESSIAEVLNTGQTLFIPELTEAHYQVFSYDDPTLFNFWHESCAQSIVYVALTAHGNTFGLVQMGTSIDGRKLSQEDLKEIEEWVNRMAANLDNARLYRDLQSVNTQLEQRVQQRTEALKISRDQLRGLAGRLQAAREEERARLSREVHDVIGQILTGLKMDISSLGRLLQSENAASLRKIADINGLLDEAIQSVRKVATELRPAVLDNFGLVAAVEWQLREFGERFGIAGDFDCAVEEIKLDNDHATAIFRLIQESLTNVARHSQATEVQVTLKETDSDLLVQIADNGRGISEEEMSANRSLGLLGMRERVKLLNGEITFQGNPGRGTTIHVQVPLRQ